MDDTQLIDTIDQEVAEELEKIDPEWREGKPSFRAGDSNKGRQLAEKRWAKHRAKQAELAKQEKADLAGVKEQERREDSKIGRETLRTLARSTTVKPEVRARAAETLLAYGEGKPKETLETTGTQTLNVRISAKMAAAHAPDQPELPPAAA